MLVLGRVGKGEEGSQPSFRCWVVDVPSNGGEDMALHLDKCGLLVRATAHLVELANKRNDLLGVLELGGDPKSSTANKLVVLLVDDASRHIAVDDVDCKVEDLGAKTELSVHLDDKVDQERAHAPLQLWLLVHKLWLCECQCLRLESAAKGVCGGCRRYEPRPGACSRCAPRGTPPRSSSHRQSDGRPWASTRKGREG